MKALAAARREIEQLRAANARLESVLAEERSRKETAVAGCVSFGLTLRKG